MASWSRVLLWLRRSSHCDGFLTRALSSSRYSSSSSTSASSSSKAAGLSLLVAAAAGIAASHSAFVSAEPQMPLERVEFIQKRDGRHPLPKSFIEELVEALDEERVVLDQDERASHGKPVNSYHPATHVPDFVVYPKTQEEIVKVVKCCNKYKIPIIPYGGATSLEGQIVTPFNGVSIDMSSMKAVKALHIEDMDVVVEPGLGWIELNEYLKPHGLFFPLDPGPGASVGGMCATRCSGSLAVRYGTMKDNVLSLKAVLANGDVIKTANRARKSAAGYDLTRLMIGSEGTLGVITEVTLRLQKIPEASVVAVCSFPSIKDAADVAIATMHCGIQVSRVEMLDEVMVKILNDANGTDFKVAPILMFEFVGTDAYAHEQTLRVQKIAEEHHGSGFLYFDSPEEKENLWRMRKEALWACLAAAPDTEAMSTDVCVPLTRLADCITKSKEALDASPLMCPIVSHAGDGNFHTVILFDPLSEDQTKEAIRLNDFMVHTALSMEGTCTGEHGVGTGKMKYMEKELGYETLKTMKKLKHALDPNNIMNPGKIIPSHVCL
ncbi:hypothetical protein GOP47_0010442 [Adiantum capillus-veneris]|uniref:D-lactate dehydrogenase (cytochrome) n=1 Tax=Adiantum capillus-veneris TaxID=13818 RepID=A0A9D4UV05_ADICA|nr:hypothetical protein GOP47_0010442 [Adiantum capillus-veneris]